MLTRAIYSLIPDKFSVRVTPGSIDMSKKFTYQENKTAHRGSLSSDSVSPEIVRRVESVKQLLYGLFLSSSNELISTTQIIGHLTLLVQHPIFVFLYESETVDENRQLSMVQYFDFTKMQIARGSRIKFTSGGQPYSSELPDEKLQWEERSRLFPVFVDQHSERQFYLRIFCMHERNEGDSEFVEVNNRDLYDLADNPKTLYDYFALCTNMLFSFSKEELESIGSQRMNQSLYGEVSKALEAAFDNQRWSKTDGRRKVTLVVPDEVEEVNQHCQEFQNDLRVSLGMLDRIYRRISHPAKTVKKFAANGDDANGIPNIFFAFRTYDRKHPRYELPAIGEKPPFSGFAHNLQFVFPGRQKDDILRMLLRYTAEQKDEMFSGLLNEQGDVKTPADYPRLRKQLDDWFWREVGKPNCGKIFEIFESPIGENTVSFLEPVLYGGVPAYRYPFRRRAGFSRIRPVKESFDKYCAVPGHRSSEFGEEHLFLDVTDPVIRKQKLIDTLQDMRRVVCGYYIFRALAPQISGRENFWTTLLLFPIVVCGSVSAVVGTVLFKPGPKSANIIPLFQDQLQPEVTRRWQYAHYFYKEIFLSVARDVRRMYRDWQIGFLQKNLHEVLIAAHAQHDAQESKGLRAAEQYVHEKSQKDDLYAQQLLTGLASVNRKIGLVGRCTPYPELHLRWAHSEADELPQGEWNHVTERAIRTPFSQCWLILGTAHNCIFRQDFAGLRTDRRNESNGESEKLSPQAESYIDIAKSRIEASLNMTLLEVSTNKSARKKSLRSK